IDDNNVTVWRTERRRSTREFAMKLITAVIKPAMLEKVKTAIAAAGVEGAWRFLQRVWRLATELSEASAAEGPTDPAALALRKATHKTIAGVTADIEGFTFNKAVARLYELANALGSAAQQAEAAGMAQARREGIETLLRLMNPMAPHLTEELWQTLGHTTPLVDMPWPQADAALARDDVILLPVQVNGKKRAEVEVARDADKDSIQALVLETPDVVRYLDGKPPKKVIVVPGRIVNVVV
ncbi:MAG: class I tRNA ligase family protein, partial [Pseudomonadota bacterium]